MCLPSTGFDPTHLTLEITETALMHDTTTVSTRLEELRASGARIALDDFGTGYSSLSYLRNFPIDVLKVDKSFIDDIASGSDSANLARGIIELGRTMQPRHRRRGDRGCRCKSWSCSVSIAAWARDITSHGRSPLTS